MREECDQHQQQADRQDINQRDPDRRGGPLPGIAQPPDMQHQPDRDQYCLRNDEWPQAGARDDLAGQQQLARDAGDPYAENPEREWPWREPPFNRSMPPE